MPTVTTKNQGTCRMGTSKGWWKDDTLLIFGITGLKKGWIFHQAGPDWIIASLFLWLKGFDFPFRARLVTISSNYGNLT